MYELIAKEGPQSQAGIAGKLTLSQASVSRMTGVLVDGGLLGEVARVRSKTGRRQILMDIRADAGNVAAVHIQAGLVRLRATDLKGRPIASPSWEGGCASLEEVLDRIEALLREAAEAGADNLITVALGVVGAWDSARRRVHVAPTTAYLEGVDLERAAAARFSIPVLVDNDVNFATMGEHSSGAARHARDFFYLDIDTGVGGGAIVNGALHHGAGGFAGEVGSLPIMRDGRYVTFEDLVAHEALTARLVERELPSDIPAFLRMVEEGDGGAEAFAEELAETIALALAAVVTVISPSLVVLGGNVGRHISGLIPLVERRLTGLVRQCPSIACTSLGADAALIGATAQALQRARTMLVSAILP